MRIVRNCRTSSIIAFLAVSHSIFCIVFWWQWQWPYTEIIRYQCFYSARIINAIMS